MYVRCSTVHSLEIQRQPKRIPRLQRAAYRMLPLLQLCSIVMASADTPSAINYASTSATPTPRPTLEPGANWAAYREQADTQLLGSLPAPSTLPSCNVTYRDIDCVLSLRECQIVNPAQPGTEVHRHNGRPATYYEYLEDDVANQDPSAPVEAAQTWTFGSDGLAGPLGGGTCVCFDRYGDCLVEAGCGTGSIPYIISSECLALPQCRRSQCEGISASHRQTWVMPLLVASVAGACFSMLAASQ